MRAKIADFAVLLMAALLLVAGTVLAAKRDKTAAGKIDEESMSILRNMGAFLAKAGQFTVKVHASYDVIQESGQKVEFGHTTRFPTGPLCIPREIVGSLRGWTVPGRTRAVAARRCPG